jgi:hypothetical protein
MANGSPHPQALPLEIGSSTHTRAAERTSAPGLSNQPGVRTGDSSTTKSSATTSTALATAVVLLAVWVPLELRVKQPMVDLRTSVRRPVLMTNLASISLASRCS